MPTRENTDLENTNSKADPRGNKVLESAKFISEVNT